MLAQRNCVLVPGPGDPILHPHSVPLLKFLLAAVTDWAVLSTSPGQPSPAARAEGPSSQGRHSRRRQPGAAAAAGQTRHTTVVRIWERTTAGRRKGGSMKKGIRVPRGAGARANRPACLGLRGTLVCLAGFPLRARVACTPVHRVTLLHLIAS